MSILDELNEELSRGRPACSFCAWLEEQGATTRDEVNDWLRKGGQAAVVWRVCVRRGADVGESTVRKHRRVCLEGIV